MRKAVLFICLLFSAIIVLPEINALAFDPPHNELNGVYCGSCHGDSLKLFDSNGDPIDHPLWKTGISVAEAYNAICLSCHNDVDAPYAITHAPNSNPIKCTTCHHNHLQEQLDIGSYNQANFFIAKGVGTAAAVDFDGTYTTISYTSLSAIRPTSEWGKAPQPDNLEKLATKTNNEGDLTGGRGALLIPRISWDKSRWPSFGIESVDTVQQKIVVLGNVSASAEAKARVADFGIFYGQQLRGIMEITPGNYTYMEFYDRTGPNGFVRNSAPYGMCQVCHENTDHWKSDGSLAGVGVHAGMDQDTDCSGCHNHVKGFKASCDACHGYPPIDGDTLVTNPGPTGSSTAGVHEEHTETQGYGCEVCHYDSKGTGPTHNDGTLQAVTMGFAPPVPISEGGTYDGQAGVDYDFTTTSPATTVSNTGSKTCSSLYCHGNYNGSGKNASPVWDNAATGDCGTCHGASNSEVPGPDPGDLKASHVRHAANLEDGGYGTWPREYACTLCHTGIVAGTGPDSYTISDLDKHVSGRVDWQFDTNDPRLDENSAYSIASGTLSPTDGTTPRAFGTCTVYCHSDVQPDGGIGSPSAYDQPRWGTRSGSFGPYCVGCHNQSGSYHSDGIDTGSHATHVRTYYFQLSLPTGTQSPKKCTICHKWNPAASNRSSCGQQCHDGDEKIYHVNGSVDVMFDNFADTAATYTGTPTPGDGYGTCQDTYCHGNFPGSGLNAEPTWGTASSGACWTCHDYNSGSHGYHVGYNLACETCHDNVVSGSSTIIDKSTHVSGSVDWTFNADDLRLQEGSEAYSIVSGSEVPTDGTSRSYGNCNNIYCHSNAQPDGGVGIPDVYAAPVWGDSGSMTCGSCHKGGIHGDSGPLIDSGSHTEHLAYPFSPSNTINCTICHTMRTLGKGSFGCSNCHAAHGPEGLLDAVVAVHVDGNVTINFETTFGASISYDGTPAPGEDGYGSCSSSYCHGNYVGSGLNATPTWGNAATGACGTCHGASNTTPPYDPRGDSYPTSQSHRVHAREATATRPGYNFSCVTCHNNTVGGSGPESYTIADKSEHIDQNMDWEFDTTDPRLSASASYSIVTDTQAPSDGSVRAYGTCSSVYCHSNAQPDGGVGSPDFYGTPEWGSVVSCGAGSCHGVDAAHDSSGPTLATGSHTAHLAYDFGDTSSTRKCAMCHKWNQNAPAQTGCTACHDSLEAHTERNKYHVNGDVDLRFETAFAGSDASYNGTAAPGDGYGSCDNTYCHSDGKSVANADMFPVEGNSTNWDGQTDPQGDGDSCNNCHDYPPTKDVHASHALRGYVCSNCHADVVDNVTHNTIINKSLHVNGEFDLAPSGQFWHGPSSSWLDVDFTYTPQPVSGNKGGNCSNISCHLSYAFKDPHDWLYFTIDSSFGYTESCSGESTVNATITNSGGTAPYECNFDWGDGSSDAWGPCIVSHDYGVRDTFTINWHARDSEGIPMSDPNPGVETINVCNTPPVPDFELVQGGGTGIDVILYERSTDADFDIADHSGTGEVKISWEGWNCGAPVKATSSAVVDLSASDPGSPPPFDRRHFFRYSTSGTYTIYIAVKDNGGDWVCSNRKQYLVQSASVSLSSTLSPPSAANCTGLANGAPTYPSFQFNNAPALENWTADNHLDPLVVAGGILSTATSGSDPIMRHSCLVLNGSDVPALNVRMKTTCGTTGQFFWTTGSDGTETEAKSQTFALTSDGTFQNYTVVLSGNAEWTGKDIRTLRLDPTNPPDATPCTIEIDYIQAVSP